MEPDILIFNKSGNEVTGTIFLKNATTDKNLTYKVSKRHSIKFLKTFIQNSKLNHFCCCCCLD